jgi:NAD(P)-dependent dehydrogenase (short-subunit alcohol dehydrogenase family)
MSIAVVTGGTRGIGKAIVHALKDAGHIVVVVARTKAEGELYIQADLSRPEARFGIIRSVVEQFGGLDILVNNAGAQAHESFLNYNTSKWNYQIELMLTAPMDLSQQAARHMLTHGGGHIINVLSTSAFQGARNIAAYVAAKHGLLGLTRAMAIELAPTVRVNAVAPGLTVTDMTATYITPERRTLLESITPAGRFGKPEEVAEAVLYLVNSSYVYGQTITVDGGWSAKNIA